MVSTAACRSGGPGSIPGTPNDPSVYDVVSVVSNFSEKTNFFRVSDVGSVVSVFSQITENFSKFDVGSVVINFSQSTRNSASFMFAV